MAEFTLAKLPRSLTDLDKPSLHALSYALRHPDTWPEGFVWDFSECAQCAMGLAHELWASVPEVAPANGPSYMARQFGIPYEVARSIFMGGTWTPSKVEEEGRLWWKKRHAVFDFPAVTPEMVADQIDEYLEHAA